MLDAKRQFSVPEVPGVLVFPDDRDDAGFYAFPATPRVASDDQGRPEVALVLYGKKTGSSFEPRGGVLTLTTSLDLTPEEARRLTAALSRRRGGSEAPAGPPRPAHILSPDVVEGSVEVRLAEGVSLTGTPSTTGGNRCSFNAKLDATQARSLQAALKRNLPDSRLTYRLHLRPGPSTSAVEIHHTGWTHRSDGVRESGSSGGMSIAAGTSEAPTFTLQGPIGPARDLGKAVTEVEL